MTVWQMVTNKVRTNDPSADILNSHATFSESKDKFYRETPITLIDINLTNFRAFSRAISRKSSNRRF